MRVCLIIFILTFTIFNFSYPNNRTLSEETASKKEEDKILYYTCGMHPQTRVSVEEYKKGKTKDPICGMDLVPVYASSIAEEGVVKLTEEEVSLASIETTSGRWCEMQPIPHRKLSRARREVLNTVSQGKNLVL